MIKMIKITKLNDCDHEEDYFNHNWTFSNDCNRLILIEIFSFFPIFFFFIFRFFLEKKKRLNKFYKMAKN